MARTAGRDGPTDRAWPAAVVLGLALVAGACVLALVWPGEDGQVLELDPAGARQAKLGLSPAPFSGSIEMGAWPSWRSRPTTASSLSASIDPAAILPSRSRTF
jgi:hypothetical protein